MEALEGAPGGSQEARRVQITNNPAFSKVWGVGNCKQRTPGTLNPVPPGAGGETAEGGGTEQGLNDSMDKFARLKVLRAPQNPESVESGVE